MPAGVIDANAEKRHHDVEHMNAESKDAARLAELGYSQDLKRGWGVLESFGCSFSIISVCTGITTLFAYGLVTGGPGVMTSGWIIVCFMTFFVAASMAEIVSCVPTSGGPYHWAAILAKPQHSAFAAWATGYFNLLGQIAVTTGITFGNAGLISTLGSVRGYEPTAARTVGIYAGLLVSHGLVNSLAIGALKWLNRISILLHSVGITGLSIGLLASAPQLRSAKEVFGFFYDGTAAGDVSWSQRASPAYTAVCGILLAQFTITGYDASAHMSEETHNAAKNAPLGVLISVMASSVFGFFLLCSYLFSIQDFDTTVESEFGQPVLQIFLDCFGLTGGTVAMAFICTCIWFCGLFSLTSNSRMIYAFSRDRALPPFLNHTSKFNSAPIRAVWTAAFLAFLLSLPSLGSSVAYAAATSIATIGLYISYIIPVIFLLIEHDRFVSIRGPFHLGKFSRPVAVVAICWVVFITIVFCLPTVNPVNTQTLNYTPVAVGIVTLYVLLSWFLWARKWFKGPRQEALVEASQEPGGTIVARKELDGGAVGEDDKSDELEPKLEGSESAARVVTARS